jgi:hypothetical protein
MNLDEKTVNLMNDMQNGLVRYMFKLHKSCHMSNILKSLKIVNIKQLIFKYKINFVRQLENHELCKEIFKSMIKNRNVDNNKSKSIIVYGLKVDSNDKSFTTLQKLFTDIGVNNNIIKANYLKKRR